MEFHDIVLCYDDTTREELYRILLAKSSLFNDIRNERCHDGGHSVDQIRIKLVDISSPSQSNGFITLYPDKFIEISALSPMLKSYDGDEFSLSNLMNELVNNTNWQSIDRAEDWNVRTFYVFSKRTYNINKEDFELSTDMWYSYLDKKLPIGKRRIVFVMVVPQGPLWCELFENLARCIMTPMPDDYLLDYEEFIGNMRDY